MKVRRTIGRPLNATARERLRGILDRDGDDALERLPLAAGTVFRGACGLRLMPASAEVLERSIAAYALRPASISAR